MIRHRGMGYSWGDLGPQQNMAPNQRAVQNAMYWGADPMRTPGQVYMSLSGLGGPVNYGNYFKTQAIHPVIQPVMRPAYLPVVGGGPVRDGGIFGLGSVAPYASFGIHGHGFGDLDQPLISPNQLSTAVAMAQQAVTLPTPNIMKTGQPILPSTMLVPVSVPESQWTNYAVVAISAAFGAGVVWLMRKKK